MPAINRTPEMTAFLSVRGRAAKIAKRLKINKATVSKWPYVPENRRKMVAYITGVSEAELPRKS
jgi:hypothetical protein